MQGGCATQVKRSMRRATDLPVHSINAPEALQGINYSDQRQAVLIMRGWQKW